MTYVYLVLAAGVVVGFLLGILHARQLVRLAHYELEVTKQREYIISKHMIFIDEITKATQAHNEGTQYGVDGMPSGTDNQPTSYKVGF